MRPMQTADFVEAAENDEIETLEVIQNSAGESRVVIHRKPLEPEDFFLTVRRKLKDQEPRVFRDSTLMLNFLRKHFKGKIISTFEEVETPPTKTTKKK